MEGGDLRLWAGPGAGSLVRDLLGGRCGRWVFQAQTGVVEAQGDGIIEITVLQLGALGAQRVCGHDPPLTSSGLPVTAGEGSTHAPQVPDLREDAASVSPFQTGTMTTNRVPRMAVVCPAAHTPGPGTLPHPCTLEKGVPTRGQAADRVSPKGSNCTSW